MDSWQTDKLESQQFTFPKLTSLNYSSWQVDMKVLLIDQDCWGYVSGETAPLPEDASEEVKQRFKRMKERAFSTIYKGVERQLLPLISHTTDGKTAWEILKLNFESSSRTGLACLLDEFHGLKFKEDEETIGIFCKRVADKSKLIKEAGFHIAERLVCFQLIRDLPADYNDLVQSLYQLDDKQFTFNYIAKQLIRESARIAQKRADKGFEADLTKSEIQFSGSSGSAPERRKYKTPRKPRVCSYCTLEGHDVRNCIARKRKFSTEDTNTAINEEMQTCELDVGLVDSAATDICNRKDFKELPVREALMGGDEVCKSDTPGAGNTIF